MTPRSSAVYFAILMLLAGCDEPFEPLAPSDIVFSIHGHLNAAADTQWVRVMPLRAMLASPALPIDAVVTLEEIETGNTVVMNDSLGRYLPIFLDDAAVYAHNFWTTMPMIPGRQYRLTATRSDGASAWGTVLIPQLDSPRLELTNYFQYPNTPGSTSLFQPTAGKLWGIRYPGMIFGLERLPEACGGGGIHQEFLPVVQKASSEDDFHEVQLSWGLGSRPFYVGGPHTCPKAEPKEIMVIASGEEWRYDRSTDLREQTHLSSVDNIEGRGVGFLAGIQIFTFPYANCSPTQRTGSCSISFSASSAVLSGTVTSSCDRDPLEGIRVTLVNPDRNAVRADTTDPSGFYQFKGVDPSSAHSLSFSETGTTMDYLPVQFDDVVFAEGAIDTVSVEMVHRRNCEEAR
jgi:hypothetical protein